MQNYSFAFFLNIKPIYYIDILGFIPTFCIFKFLHFHMFVFRNCFKIPDLSFFFIILSLRCFKYLQKKIWTNALLKSFKDINNFFCLLFTKLIVAYLQLLFFFSSCPFFSCSQSSSTICRSLVSLIPYYEWRCIIISI